MVGPGQLRVEDCLFPEIGFILSHPFPFSSKETKRTNSELIGEPKASVPSKSSEERFKKEIAPKCMISTGER